MSAFRVLNQKPVYYDTTNPSGPVVCAGGSLNFYITNTSTPASVYSDPGLSVNIGSSVALDSLGQQTYDIWGDIEYRVVLKNSAGATVWSRDNVRDLSAGGLSIPALVADYVLSNDGAILQWILARFVPDPTGNSGKILGNDGTTALWQSLASLNIPATSSAVGKLVFGDVMILSGTGTAPASGATTTSLAVTFSDTFASAPIVVFTPIGAQPGGPVVPYLSAAASTTTFTAVFDVAEGASSGANVVNPQPFTWIAVGIKA